MVGKGYLMVTVGQQGQLKENLTELHIIVRTTGLKIDSYTNSRPDGAVSPRWRLSARAAARVMSGLEPAAARRDCLANMAASS